MNREKLEKERISQRTEKHIRPKVVTNIITDTNCDKKENAYMRKPDMEYQNFVNREQQKLKEYAKIESKRKEMLNRDETRWQREEQAAKNEIEKSKRLQQMPFKSEKNKSKSNRDIISHQYKDAASAAKEENKREMFAQNRREYLKSKISSYNPITGEKK